MPSWLGADKLAEVDESKEPTIATAMSTAGYVIVTWVQSSGTNSVIDASSRSPGGSFSTPIELSPPDVTAYHPVVAIDPQGEATVAWLSYVPGEGGPSFSNVEATWSPAGGTFHRPVSLSKHEEEGALAIAMGSRGATTIVWSHYNDEVHLIEAASRPAEGAFGAPFELTVAQESGELQDAGSPTVATDPEGYTIAAWSSGKKTPGGESEHGPYDIQVVTQSAGGTFGKPINLDGERQCSPVVAMGPQDDATVVCENPGPGENTIEAFAQQTAGGPFGAPTILGKSSGIDGNPFVATDTADETLIGWSSTSINIVTRAIGNQFSNPMIVAGPGEDRDQPVIAMDDQGDSALAWAERGPAGAFTKASIKPAGGVFDEPTFLSNSPIYARGTYGPTPVSVAVDSQGDAVTAWMGSYGEYSIPEVAGYQAGGPRLEALQAPTESQTGTALAFSVYPLSVWSTVASTTWSWGDGSPDTSGTNVTHTFDTPGTYQVTVRATDALGNVTNITHTVTIQAADGGGSHTVPVITHAQRKSTLPEAVVAAFKSRFATRAAIRGSAVGLLVGIGEMTGLRNGDTILLHCIVGCQRHLRDTVHIRRHHDPHGDIPISPPLLLLPTTRIEIELLAPKHVARFVQYGFTRRGLDVTAHVTRKGCLSSAGRRTSCP